MRKINIIDDMGKINNLSVDVLNKISCIESCIIADSISESPFDRDFEFDIGIGKLYIFIERDKSGKFIQYKFVPSSDLEDNVRKVVKGGRSPLTKTVEKSLQDKVFNTYKDLM